MFFRGNDPETRKKDTRLVVFLLLIGFVFAIGMSEVLKRPFTGDNDAEGGGSEGVVTPRGDLYPGEKDMIALFRRVSPSVVHIVTKVSAPNRLHKNQMEMRAGEGTGFVWDDKGHVVTNYHVIEESLRSKPFSVEVEMGKNGSREGQVIGWDVDKDLAVVRLNKSPRVSPIEVGTSKDLQVGQTVLAIGNPFGMDQTLTTGVISGLGREIRSLSMRPIRGVIQTDAAINPGNSGGPLLDSAGRLIGVNTAIYSPTGAYAGIGYAVPVDTVRRIVPELIRSGKVRRPGLGVVIFDENTAYQLGVDSGVVINYVPRQSVAARAGLKGTVRHRGVGIVLGDIIVSVDGKQIRNADDLYKALDTHRVGDKVEVTVNRQGKLTTTKLTLQAIN